MLVASASVVGFTCTTPAAKWANAAIAARRVASPVAVRAEQWLNGGDGLYLLSSKSFNLGRDQALSCVSSPSYSCRPHFRSAIAM